MKSKPTNLRILQGNPGKRPLNKNEPKPETGIPQCPGHLSIVAKKEWNRISHELELLGLLTKLDLAALAMYCENYGRWVYAEKKIRADGMIVTAQSGFPVQSPYLGIANKAMEQMLKMLVEFGMTPSSRSKVSSTGQKKKNDFESF